MSDYYSDTHMCVDVSMEDKEKGMIKEEALKLLETAKSDLVESHINPSLTREFVVNLIRNGLLAMPDGQCISSTYEKRVMQCVKDNNDHDIDHVPYCSYCGSVKEELRLAQARIAELEKAIRDFLLIDEIEDCTAAYLIKIDD
jgi:hypothetical protein